MASPQIEKEPAIATVGLNKFFLYIYCNKKTFSGQLAFRTNFSYRNIVAYFWLSTKDCDMSVFQPKIATLFLPTTMYEGSEFVMFFSVIARNNKVQIYKKTMQSSRKAWS